MIKGTKHSEETKQKMREYARNRPPTQKQLQALKKYRDYMEDNGMPEYHKERLREGQERRWNNG